MYKKVVLFLSSLILSCLFLVAPVSALEPGDVVMSLKPSEQDVELSPGSSYRGSITVSNVGRLPFDVHASVVPYYVSDDSYNPDFITESSYTKLHTWIQLDQDTYHLEPEGSVNIGFTINVPEDVAGGGQYAAIMLASDADDGSDSAMKVTSQLAALIYGHINGGQMRAEGELIGHTLPNFLFNSDFNISQTVKNSGNVDFKVTQKLTIVNFFSNREVIGPDSIGDDGQYLGYNVSTVLPGTSRTGILSWKDTPMLGLFRVTQEISFLDQEYTYSKLVLICPIWLIIIILAVLIALIVMLIIKIKKKLQPKAEVL